LGGGGGGEKKANVVVFNRCTGGKKKGESIPLERGGEEFGNVLPSWKEGKRGGRGGIGVSGIVKPEEGRKKERKGGVHYYLITMRH